MKALLLSAFLCCVAFTGISQITYTLKIINTDGQPVKNVEVTAQHTTEKSTVLKSRTDGNGAVVFTLSVPGMYTFSYLEMKDVATCEVEEGISGRNTRTTTYDPEGVFAVSPNINRSGMVFKTVPALEMRSKPNVAKVTIEVKEKTHAHVSNLPLTIVSGADKLKFTGKTNASGLAVFYLPIAKSYEIDVNGVEAYHKFKVRDVTGMEMQEVVFYEKTNVQETAKGDTIVQRAITQTSGTSSHLLFTLQLNDYEGVGLANEPVYLDEENGKRVYQGVTDATGKCVFMLAKGHNYLVNVKYERGIHLVDATTVEGFSSAMATRRYRGSAATERMLEERKMNEKGFVVNHRETPIHTANKPTNYLKQTTQGFDIDFGNSGPIGTPTIIGDKMYTQAGFYSPSFYCLNAATGNYLWGVELGESGMSPAVYQSGVLLVNTYSCTLYALDALTGKLLWSKWLAGTIYSTPSADDKSVYVVYNNGGSNPAHTGEEYVLASFDLKSGKVNWMSWVDREVIACPVVEGTEVHVASQSGNYYVFDKTSGKEIAVSKTVKAVSSPTVTPDAIFLTATVAGKEQLVSLDRKTLQVKKRYAKQLNPAKINGGSYEQMNFNGSHPIVYKNKTLILLDSTQIVAFDATSEQVLWQQAVRTNPNQVPVVANDKIIVGTRTGAVMSFDINTGASQVVKQSTGDMDGQPVARNGFLYLAANGALIVIKAVQKFQWEQWNKDARHNLYWE